MFRLLCLRKCHSKLSHVVHNAHFFLSFINFFFPSEINCVVYSFAWFSIYLLLIQIQILRQWSKLSLKTFRCIRFCICIFPKVLLLKPSNLLPCGLHSPMPSAQLCPGTNLCHHPGIFSPFSCAGSLVFYISGLFYLGLCMWSCFNHIQLFVTPWTGACQPPLSMGLSWQECCSGLPVTSQGIFSNRGLNPGFLHRRQILYHLSHQGSPFLGLLPALGRTPPPIVS